MIERIRLAEGLDIPRVVTGLWQVADMERDGRRLDPDAAAAAMAEYAAAGFDAFDMADHYGSAEDIAGRCRRLLAARGAPAPRLFTKWVPEPGAMAPDLSLIQNSERPIACA
ncbi:MAG: aldo/keto reductase, partial [Rhodospirillaceae bacterium]|nr:aldo/keto reductase [Rhodospirillaceae bacterium]